jgi:glycosyltransferase involved in cell wall biosynthesis
MSTSKWDELVQSRIGYYDIVIVTRPSTFKATYEKWKDFYKQKSFSFIYDSEALWFRRDELLDEIVQSKKIDFPGYQNDLNQELTRLVTQIKRRSELSLIQMAETFIAVSKQEKKVIKMLLPHDTNVKIIGFVMDLKTMTKNAFSERNGILFLAAFHNSMYYNGDAIWYFLKFIYPRIIEATFNNRVPALTIAGRGIPDELYEFVKANKLITNYITFLESPPSIEELFETNRILIAPHLYGAGIQYKVSEALAAGLPVVMSEFTKESFGGEAPGCTGFDPESFAKCVIDVHDNQEQWEFLRSEGLSYILRTHSRKEVMKQWSEIIGSSFKDVAKKRSKKLLDVRMNLPTERCEEGEDIYLSQFEDIAIAVKEGRIGSGFEHWSEFGKYEGRNSYCRKMAF